jgi:hypothetical protein
MHVVQTGQIAAWYGVLQSATWLVTTATEEFDPADAPDFRDD